MKKKRFQFNIYISPELRKNLKEEFPNDSITSMITTYLDILTTPKEKYEQHSN